MTESDRDAFRQMFSDVFYSGLPRTPGRDKFEQVCATYFEALQPYPISGIQAAYDNLQRTATGWPPVSAWIASIRSNPVASLPQMDWRNVRESDEAEARFYEGDPCSCRECTQAGATHLPLRFVPCLDANGAVIPMQHPKRIRPVLLGEWIHGHRLKRWYATRAEFYVKLEATKPKAIPRPEVIPVDEPAEV